MQSFKMIQTFVFLSLFLAPLDAKVADPHGIDPLPILGLDQVAFEGWVKWTTEGGPHQTNALFVIYQGKTLHHSVHNGFKKGQLHRQWSVSKSLTSLLVGIAQEKGLLNISESVKKIDPSQSQLHDDLKIKHLLEMTSGLRWEEGYASSPFFSDVIAMLYTKGFHDMSQMTLEKGHQFA
ncbi:MAG: serine hydrolase, partial [Pseudomonadota bacterium]